MAVNDIFVAFLRGNVETMHNIGYIHPSHYYSFLEYIGDPNISLEAIKAFFVITQFKVNQKCFGATPMEYFVTSYRRHVKHSHKLDTIFEYLLSIGADRNQIIQLLTGYFYHHCFLPLIIKHFKFIITDNTELKDRFLKEFCQYIRYLPEYGDDIINLATSLGFNDSKIITKLIVTINNEEAIRLFMKHGFDPNIKDDNDYTPIDRLAEKVDPHSPLSEVASKYMQILFKDPRTELNMRHGTVVQDEIQRRNNIIRKYQNITIS
jgi:hypothetical protein